MGEKRGIRKPRYALMIAFSNKRREYICCTEKTYLFFRKTLNFEKLGTLGKQQPARILGLGSNQYGPRDLDNGTMTARRGMGAGQVSGGRPAGRQVVSRAERERKSNESGISLWGRLHGLGHPRQSYPLKTTLPNVYICE